MNNLPNTNAQSFIVFTVYVKTGDDEGSIDVVDLPGSEAMPPMQRDSGSEHANMTYRRSLRDLGKILREVQTASNETAVGSDVPELSIKDDITSTPLLKVIWRPLTHPDTRIGILGTVPEAGHKAENRVTLETLTKVSLRCTTSPAWKYIVWVELTEIRFVKFLRKAERVDA